MVLMIVVVEGTQRVVIEIETVVGLYLVSTLVTNVVTKTVTDVTGGKGGVGKDELYGVEVDCFGVVVHGVVVGMVVVSQGVFELAEILFAELS